MSERADFEAWLASVDPETVIVLDETGIVRGMRLGYGYAPRGERVCDTAPVGRRKRLNILGWLRLAGDACLANWTGPVTRRVFAHFVERYLLPGLKKGDTVVWDNASFHRDDRLLAKLKRRGVKVKRLPRYSPEYNPIELMWQKLKHYLKKMRIDEFGKLESGVEKALDQIKVSDVRGWFAKCGFNVSTD